MSVRVRPPAPITFSIIVVPVSVEICPIDRFSAQVINPNQVTTGASTAKATSYSNSRSPRSLISD